MLKSKIYLIYINYVFKKFEYCYSEELESPPPDEDEPELLLPLELLLPDDFGAES